ncbi:MAG: pyruvate formate lyase family protein, partial [Desulfofustis sp.]
NHTAPPKVGVTAQESGTYNDFTQINLGGVKSDGSDGSNEVSYLALEISAELQLLQPQPSVHISRVTPDRFLKAAGRVIRNGYGYPSVFNSDMVVMEQIRVGKSIEHEARVSNIYRSFPGRIQFPALPAQWRSRAGLRSSLS